MPEIKSDDTIAAIATPIGEGGIAVLRVSGPETFSIARRVFRPKNKLDLSRQKSHTIHWGEILNAREEILDQVLVSLFKQPNSYTGEDVIEISCHGGLVVARQILEVLYRLGARPAEPGEFTKRAFLNGKMDLTQAEAVLDLIKAKSEKSLAVAVRQLSGSLSQKFKEIKNELMLIYAHMESFLDFPEEHLEVYSDKTFSQKFSGIREEIQTLIRGFKRGILIREGISVVLAGKPNVGKSSLFNLLLSRDRALVSEYPGTTRDSLEEAIELGGFYIRLMDTAGLASDPAHPVDKMGMERTRLSLASGDLFLYILDGSTALDSSDKTAFESIPPGKPVIVLVNKTDLPQKLSPADLKFCSSGSLILEVSTKTREGLETLERTLQEMVGSHSIENEGEQIIRARHSHALERASQALDHAEKSFRREESLEIVIVDVKTALDEMRELIGEIYSEDLLDVIFSEFCIGK